MAGHLQHGGGSHSKPTTRPPSASVVPEPRLTSASSSLLPCQLVFLLRRWDRSTGATRWRTWWSWPLRLSTTPKSPRLQRKGPFFSIWICRHRSSDEYQINVVALVCIFALVQRPYFFAFWRRGFSLLISEMKSHWFPNENESCFGQVEYEMKSPLYYFLVSC